MTRKFILILAGILLVFAYASRADALIIEPAADATIFDFGFINNTGYPQAADISRAIIEYDLSLITESVSSAILSLNVEASSDNYPLGLGFYFYDADGTITGDDYDAGNFFTSYSYSGETNIQIDVTSVLQNMVSNSYDYAGFNIRLLNPGERTDNNYVAFNSLEHPYAAELYINQPVNAIPEPATMALFSIGLIGAARLRRKHNNTTKTTKTTKVPGTF